jgi:four helix bundle protein
MSLRTTTEDEDEKTTAMTNDARMRGRCDCRCDHRQSTRREAGTVTRHFDHERLDVYRLELEFVAWATDLMAELRDSLEAKMRRVREVVDHLDRASLSVLFNTAEGNGKRQMRTRAKFFDDARGSATECAACLDALVAKGACPEQRTEEGRMLLLRIVSILTKLVQKFSASVTVREEGIEYGAEITDDCRKPMRND